MKLISDEKEDRWEEYFYPILHATSNHMRTSVMQYVCGQVPMGLPMGTSRGNVLVSLKEGLTAYCEKA